MKKLSLLIMLSIFFLNPLTADEHGPCKDDGPKLCPGEKFGHGKMFECLSGQLEKLSPACRKNIDQMMAYKKACQKEIDLHCKGKPFYCLYKQREKLTDLSPECKAQMDKE